MGNIRERNGKLFFDFRVHGIRCREQTALDDSPANRKRMEKVLERIEQAIVSGTFQYTDFFPGSKQAEKFATERASHDAARTQPAQAPAAPNTPLFRTFIEDWYRLSLPSWRASHAATVRSTIDCHLTPYLGEIPVGSITKADILRVRAEIAQRKGRSGNATLSARPGFLALAKS
ncbi:MAG: Arm DNA-binding domain-containing protein [Metallibacterium sp.]